jgi:oligopeptide transport system substrate-binding protein
MRRILLLILLALGVSGCGPRLEESAGQRDRTLYLTSLRIRGFDPAKVGDVSSAQAIQRIYEGLLQVAYLERPYRLEPLLAEAMPAKSEDGLRYTFRLRRGIHFQDDPCFPGGAGREVIAEDVVYSLKRLADRKVGSSGWWAFEGRIAGLDAFRAASAGDGATDYGAGEGLRAPDRYTVEMVLTRSPTRNSSGCLRCTTAASSHARRLIFMANGCPVIPSAPGPTGLRNGGATTA